MQSPFMTPAADRALERTFERAMDAAGQALGDMSGQAIHVMATEVIRTDAEHVIASAGGAGTLVVGVYVGLAGSLHGHALLVLRPPCARRLARTLLDGYVPPRPADAESLDFDELELSTLREVANVAVCGFLNEVGRHLDQPAGPTVPVVVTDMAGAVLDGILADLSTDSDELLVADLQFINGGETILGCLLVMPQRESLRVVITALGAA